MPRSTNTMALPPAIPRRNDSRRRSRSLTRDFDSRVSSTNSLRQRVASTDIHSQPHFAASAERFQETANRKSMMGGAFKVADIKRWDGNRRTTTNWNSLKRDPELWFPSGDCLVHFYGKGQSRRGPSLRLSLIDIEESNCRPFLEQCCATPVPESPSAATDSGSSSSDDGGFFTNPSLSGKYELYVPAPANLNREEAFQYHLTTRNFFAWMFEKPLAGCQLGTSLISLMERMNTYRPDPAENEDDILAYIDNQGYTDFRECPDHALAVLQFAEKFQYGEIWTDSFVHCVGMNDQLMLSAEFKSLSRVSKALITRAHLEMNLRLERAGNSLGTFLEDDLTTCLGLSSDAQKHLERFRSFLESFYVQKYGYWPPARTDKKGSALPKSTLRSMYFDFRHLYEYLVDPNSSTSMNSNRPADGGICVLQNVQAFDKKYKYSSLPTPLPLIPKISASTHRPRAGGISSLFGNKAAKTERRIMGLSALTAATNCDDLRVMESPLVSEYFRFEREWTMREDEKISPSDARKVRWILIYSILQTLISVTRAPVEVRDTEGVTYPLCCQTAGTPPWTIQSSTPPSPTTATISVLKSAIIEAITEIKPDMPHYYPSSYSPAPVSAAPSTPPPRPFHPLDTLARNASNTTLPIRCPQPRKPFSEILVNGYGNGRRTSDAEISDPETPSSGGSTESSRWSPASSDEGAALAMDHHSLYDGREEACSPSIYGDEDGVGEVMEMKWQMRKESVGVRKMASVDSWGLGRANPEVEMYVMSPSR